MGCKEVHKKYYKKMKEVIENTEDILEIGQEMIDRLVKLAEESPMKRSRIIMHHSREELVQDSVLVILKNSYIRPHRHPKTKAESFHIIHGELDVYIFDDSGKVLRKIEMGDQNSNKAFIFRSTSGIWHGIIPKTNYVVVHEVYTGPFNKELDVEYSTWSPDEWGNKEDIERFVESLRNIN